MTQVTRRRDIEDVADKTFSNRLQKVEKDLNVIEEDLNDALALLNYFKDLADEYNIKPKKKYVTISASEEVSDASDSSEKKGAKTLESGGEIDGQS